MDQRWHSLRDLLKQTKSKVMLKNETKQFYEELTSLRGILLSYERWISTVEGMSEEALEITKQLEQCRVSGHMAGGEMASPSCQELPVVPNDCYMFLYSLESSPFSLFLNVDKLMK